MAGLGGMDVAEIVRAINNPEFLVADISSFSGPPVG